MGVDLYFSLVHLDDGVCPAPTWSLPTAPQRTGQDCPAPWYLPKSAKVWELLSSSQRGAGHTNRWVGDSTRRMMASRMVLRGGQLTAQKGVVRRGQWGRDDRLWRLGLLHLYSTTKNSSRIQQLQIPAHPLLFSLKSKMLTEAGLVPLLLFHDSHAMQHHLDTERMDDCSCSLATFVPALVCNTKATNCPII